MVQNAGADGSVVVGKGLDSEDTNIGFDAQAEDYMDLVTAGIIDPTKVVRVALRHVRSVDRSGEDRYWRD